MFSIVSPGKKEQSKSEISTKIHVKRLASKLKLICTEEKCFPQIKPLGSVTNNSYFE